MTGARYVDPVLLAVSDGLVLTALERAWARVVPRSNRMNPDGAAWPRHEGYLHVAIDPDRLDKALQGAWDLVPMLTDRHDLDTDPGAWAALLDAYTRALLMACEPHVLARLRPHLGPLGITERWSRPYLAVAQ